MKSSGYRNIMQTDHTLKLFDLQQPNSTNPNSIRKVWDIMERQFRSQKPPLRNIEEFCDLWLNMCYNVFDHLPRTCGIRAEVDSSCSWCQR
ncbi:hypothetical protein NPIL_628671 [Nephila pilipes]|uniref:Uncharacterized protein n=1 Tax=Nephila pilipes TaxID=299642 RepID=A0A8X6R494_NEPPI|nr:hypothetical protein NPIL_628671 [Nephila pilipes]